jgi:hypothetical protein
LKKISLLLNKEKFWKEGEKLKKIYYLSVKKEKISFFLDIIERYHEVILLQGILNVRVVGLEQPSKHGYLR